MKIPLIGGSYEARSLIADIRRCLNLYPEKNPETASAPYTYYPVPGLRKLVRSPEGSVAWRCLYEASNGDLFGVAGRSVYFIDRNWVLHKLGVVNIGGEKPVSMLDNGTQAVITDGSSGGWLVDLVSHAFSALSDPEGLFSGSTSITSLDGFTIFNKINSAQFYSTLNSSFLFDGTWIAKKATQPDLLQAVEVKNKEIWLLGERTCEVWYNAGNEGFPFQSMPGTLLEFGLLARHSLGRLPGALQWLARNDQGQAMMVRAEQYQPQRISTYAIENTINAYQDLTEVISVSYWIAGHAFQEFTFPSADRTWTFDASENLWHERGYYNENTGELERSRLQCTSVGYGRQIGGDYQNGWLYEITTEEYTDFGGPVVRTVTFPHLGNDAKRVCYNCFTADVQLGEGTEALQLALRWSDTRGRTWGTPVRRQVDRVGEFESIATWWGLGMARDRVFELSWSTDTKTALQGAFVELEPAET